jgi:hypothetical protein
MKRVSETHHTLSLALSLYLSPCILFLFLDINSGQNDPGPLPPRRAHPLDPKFSFRIPHAPNSQPGSPPLFQCI